MSRGTAYYDLPNGERIELPTTMPDVEEVPGPLCDGKFELPEAVKEIMDAVKNDVKRLVKIELAAANKKFRMFAGPHEGAGIIQEEVVEAAREMNGLRRKLNAMWIGVYSNNPQISTKGVYDRAVALAVEAIQTAAMARKFERSQRRHWPGAKDPHYGEEE